MRDRILRILQNTRPDVDFENEEKLIDDGILDSFDIISIINELCESFHIEIDVEDLEPENFNSMGSMIELIKKRQA